MTPKCKVLAMGLLLAAVPLFAANPAAISGDYVEVRSNHVYTCGCLYSGEQVTGGREAILAWAFRQGEFYGVPLAQTKAVAVIQGAANLGLDGAARKSLVFVDGASSEAQRLAVLALVRERFADLLGEIQGVQTASITVAREGERVSVSVGEIARLVVRPARLPEDAHLGSFLWYDPFMPVLDSTLATTEYNSFSGEDLERRWWSSEAGINGYMGTFHLAPGPS